MRGARFAGRSRGHLETVRAHLVAALHAGRLKPGDRVPSVRRMAEIAEIDRKTVHRAYSRLAREGLLETRVGSGTYLAERTTVVSRPVRASELLAAANRCRAEAAALGLRADQFARFLGNVLGPGLQGMALAVAECNGEQNALFAREIGTALGVQCRPVLIADLARSPTALLGGLAGVVTTDFHHAEVLGATAPAGLPVYRVALESAFPRAIVEHARRGPVVMIVRDASFAPRFLEFLEESGVPAGVLARVRVVEPRDARAAFRQAGGDGVAYLSPLVDEAVRSRIPGDYRILRFKRHLSSASIERLRVRLALDATLATE